MQRRRFLQAAALGLMVPPAAVFGRSAGLAGEEAGADFLFFDDRFDAARLIAAAWPAAAAPIAVQGDITDIWTSRLRHACRQSALSLGGVTTESFHFCLKIMLAERARIESRITRIDRDLHLWTIHSGRLINQGMRL